MNPSDSPDRLQAFSRLVADMPGGHLIGDSWRDEPMVLVNVTSDDYQECFTRRVFADILTSFPVHGQEEPSRQLWLYLPWLAAQWLQWEADAYLWWADSVDVAEHYPALAAMDGNDLCALLNRFARHTFAFGDHLDGYADHHDILQVASDLVVAAAAAGVDLNDAIDTAVVVLDQGYDLDDIARLSCAVQKTPLLARPRP